MRTLISNLKQIEQTDFSICGYVSNTNKNKLFIDDYTGQVKVNYDSPDINTLNGASIEAIIEFSKLDKAYSIKNIIKLNKRLNMSLYKENKYISYNNKKDLYTIMKIKEYIRNFFKNQYFLETDFPILWGNISEYGQQSIRVDTLQYKYLDSEYMFLSQSPAPQTVLGISCGLERSFQFSKCFRWEDNYSSNFKALEFTQLNIMMAFSSMEEITQIVLDLLIGLFYEFNIKINYSSLDTISYNTANKLYGTEDFNSQFSHILTPKNHTKQYFLIPNLLTNLDKNKLHSIFKKRYSTFKISTWSDELTNILHPIYINKKIYTIFSVDISEIDNGLDNILPILSKLCSYSPSSHKLNIVEHLPYMKKREEYENKNLVHFSRNALASTYKDKNGELHTNSKDIYINGIEIASGSEYETDVIKFLNNLKIAYNKNNLEDVLKEYDFYLSTLKNGTPSVVCYGIGLERIISIILGKSNIMDSMLFPKYGNGMLRK